MIKVNKYASLKFCKVAYLSFNIEPRCGEIINKRVNLLLEFQEGIYTIYSDGQLMLRKIKPDAPMMEYMYLNKGKYTFIEDIESTRRLILLDK